MDSTGDVITVSRTILIDCAYENSTSIKPPCEECESCRLCKNWRNTTRR